MKGAITTSCAAGFYLIVVLWCRMFRIVELTPHHHFLFCGKKVPSSEFSRKMCVDEEEEGGTDDGGLDGIE